MTTTSHTARGGLWASLGSVLAAVVASACCWLPLLLLAFGASAAGLSATFEKLRPLFLGVTAVLLGAGFYLEYFRKETCAPDSACATPRPGLRRFSRGMLWFATVMVAVFAFFPNYVGLLARSSEVETASQVDGSVLTLGVEGMTCEACTITVKSALDDVPGVLDSSVDFDAGQARVRIDPSSPPAGEALERAVEQAGYKLTETH